MDFVWWRSRQGAMLVAESEWLPATYEILKDFDKIAVMKAPFKLMIYCTVPRGPSSSHDVAAFEDYLRSYEQHIEGETYIFLEFMPHDYAQALFGRHALRAKAAT